MYSKHFKLNKNPFELNQDPRFLFQTPSHNEALASIYYAITRHKGFAVLTGEVGTGKTLLLKCILSLLKDSHFASAFVFNPRLDSTEFLRYVLADFGLPCDDGKAKMMLELNRFLLSERHQGRTAVLIVDEAQQLEEDSLEEIRLLTNLESTQDKLLQIVLAGQPELDEKLDSVGLRQLKQRVAVRCRLSALDEVATFSYICRRLEVAGCSSETARLLFPVTAVHSVHRHSKGIPRLINVICDNAMISAYAKGIDQVSAAIVDEVATDLRLAVCNESIAKASQTEIAVDLLKRLLKTVEHDEAKAFGKSDSRRRLV